MDAKTPPAKAPRWTGAKLWPLGKIKPYDDNPRTHPPAQIELLARLFDQFGPDQPIVVDEGGVILKGHGRLLAARAAGMKVFPVVQRRGLSADDKSALRISDNQVALLSGWDRGLLRQELVQLKAHDYSLADLGFGDVQLVEFMAGGPAAPGEFQSFGEDIPTEHECPKCFYRWSGQSAPKPAADPPAKKKRK